MSDMGGTKKEDFKLTSQSSEVSSCCINAGIFRSLCILCGSWDSISPLLPKSRIRINSLVACTKPEFSFVCKAVIIVVFESLSTEATNLDRAVLGRVSSCSSSENEGAEGSKVSLDNRFLYLASVVCWLSSPGLQ